MISLAPMVDRTDRYFRYLCRLLSPNTLLYTEMITCQAILNGDLDLILGYHEEEHPIALQIAGSNAEEVYKAIKMANSYNYDAINLNVGCPSDRVSGNEMGACLMAYPDRVKDMVIAIKEATDKKVTVKHRIGIDGTGILPAQHKQLWDTYDDLYAFVETMDSVKVEELIIHARIAILAGLSPKENREIPPIRYEDIYAIKKDFPHIDIVINGGIASLEDVDQHLKHVDGIMIGRKFYDDPFFLAKLDRHLYDTPIKNRADIIKELMPYIKEMTEKGHKPHLMLQHALNLFHGMRGSKQWKQLLSPQSIAKKGAMEVLQEALISLPEESLISLK